MYAMLSKTGLQQQANLTYEDKYNHQRLSFSCPTVTNSYERLNPKARSDTEDYDMLEKAAWAFYEEEQLRLDFLPVDYQYASSLGLITNCDVTMLHGAGCDGSPDYDFVLPVGFLRQQAYYSTHLRSRTEEGARKQKVGRVLHHEKYVVRKGGGRSSASDRPAPSRPKAKANTAPTEGRIYRDGPASAAEMVD